MPTETADENKLKSLAAVYRKIGEQRGRAVFEQVLEILKRRWRPLGKRKPGRSKSVPFLVEWAVIIAKSRWRVPESWFEAKGIEMAPCDVEFEFGDKDAGVILKALHDGHDEVILKALHDGHDETVRRQAMTVGAVGMAAMCMVARSGRPR